MRKYKILALLAVFAVIVAACSSDSDSTTTTAADTTTTTAAEPTSVRAPQEGPNDLAIAESFTRARSDGNTDAVLLLIADDAAISIGSATTKGEIAKEMRWQKATGLVSTFDRCELRSAPIDGDTTKFACYGSWTGSVATSLGYGPSTFKYVIDITDGSAISGVLLVFDGYTDSTAEPFREWMLQEHIDDMATMYTRTWYADLSDESIELWGERTSEFVAEQ